MDCPGVNAAFRRPHGARLAVVRPPRGLYGHKGPWWSNGAVTARRPTVQRIDDPDEEGPDVRPAEQRDVPRIAATLTIALGDSRWTRWALPDDGRMQRLTRLAELDAGHRGVSTHSAWVTDDVAAVAVWEPPAGGEGTAALPADVRAALARELPYLAADRWPAVAATASLVDAARPEGPHWRLAHLGVRPTARRKGLAAAVLAPALLRCDAEGIPAAAAVFSWANVRFLRGFGFEVTLTTRTTDDEMPLWVLVRQPQRR
jgi:GNAT superfamily N-acetyltransferase